MDIGELGLSYGGVFRTLRDREVDVLLRAVGVGAREYAGRVPVPDFTPRAEEPLHRALAECRRSAPGPHAADPLFRGLDAQLQPKALQLCGEIYTRVGDLLFPML
eukprot:COSAG01_NODE_21367_length_905_cov_1.040943_1_plen_105_part_00